MNRLANVRCGLLVAIGASLALAAAPVSAADPGDDGSGSPVPVQVSTPGSDDAKPAAVAACGEFADILDQTASYYGDFADALETYAQPDYSDPATSSSNATGRTALRQAAGAAMSAAGTPGLTPDIADPMRAWSVGATKLLIKMGLHGSGDSLNKTANDMNNSATSAQQGCAAAGTHA